MQPLSSHRYIRQRALVFQFFYTKQFQTGRAIVAAKHQELAIIPIFDIIFLVSLFDFIKKYLSL